MTWVAAADNDSELITGYFVVMVQGGTRTEVAGENFAEPVNMQVAGSSLSFAVRLMDLVISVTD